MSTVYFKRSGPKWVVEGDPDTIRPGADLQVTRKDGSHVRVRIGRVGKIFLRNGTPRCYGYPSNYTQAPCSRCNTGAGVIEHNGALICPLCARQDR